VVPRSNDEFCQNVWCGKCCHVQIEVGKGKKRRIPPDVSERFIVHMNKDYPDAVLLLARYYGALSMATAASILEFDLDGMLLSVSAPHSPTPVQVRVDFPKRVQVSGKAHVPTLISAIS